MANNKELIRSFERTRAANIVLRYENQLRDNLAAFPGAKNAYQVSTIISRLQSLRAEIMGSMKPYVAPIKRDPGGDFSLEEIEAAMNIIKEPESNPFEEDAS